MIANTERNEIYKQAKANLKANGNDNPDEDTLTAECMRLQNELMATKLNAMFS